MGAVLFVSGQVGNREDASDEPVIEKQVQTVPYNHVAVLKAAGCTFGDVVGVTWRYGFDPATKANARLPQPA